jgi:hypothetical protein
MSAPPHHDEVASFAWTTFNESILQIINRIIEFSIVKPEALINETVGVLDEDHAFITQMAQIEYVPIHPGPTADLHVSKLNGLVPYRTKRTTPPRQKSDHKIPAPARHAARSEKTISALRSNLYMNQDNLSPGSWRAPALRNKIPNKQAQRSVARSPCSTPSEVRGVKSPMPALRCKKPP